MQKGKKKVIEKSKMKRNLLVKELIFRMRFSIQFCLASEKWSERNVKRWKSMKNPMFRWEKVIVCFRPGKAFRTLVSFLIFSESFTTEKDGKFKKILLKFLLWKESQKKDSRVRFRSLRKNACEKLEASEKRFHCSYSFQLSTDTEVLKNLKPFFLEIIHKSSKN